MVTSMSGNHPMTVRTTTISLLAMASACGWAIPAQAQDANAAAILAELAEMRAGMAQMAARMETLQAQLDQANAKELEKDRRIRFSTAAPAPGSP
jgi:hypothetical protein